MKFSRRTVLVLGLAGAALAAPHLARRLAPLPAATPIPGLPGWERLETGAITAGSPALLALEDGAAEDTREDTLRTDPAAALFADAVPHTVPLAFFTDVNCPNCRPLSRLIETRLQGGSPAISVTWHELPLLGPGSETAARAALAAGLQGAYLPVHARLMLTRFRPSASYLRDLAQAAGIDPDRLIADMDSIEVTARLDRAAGLARLFGIPGTPALIAGRTLAIGALGPRQLNALIRRAA